MGFQDRRNGTRLLQRQQHPEAAIVSGPGPSAYEGGAGGQHRPQRAYRHEPARPEADPAGSNSFWAGCVWPPCRQPGASSFWGGRGKSIGLLEEGSTGIDYVPVPYRPQQALF